MPKDNPGGYRSTNKPVRVAPAGGGATPGSVKKSRTHSAGGGSTGAGARKKSWAPRP